jgi:CO dehydrogenase/acetyl-CoA synthase delta subunit
VFFDIIHHAILNDPLETIELRDCGFQVEGIILVVENGNALMAAENVEALLAETLEFELILVVDLEPDEFARGSGEFVDGIIELGIIGDEPVDDSERDARFSIDDRHHCL